LWMFWNFLILFLSCILGPLGMWWNIPRNLLSFIFSVLLKGRS
jgi:hypothetical protein